MALTDTSPHRHRRRDLLCYAARRAAVAGGTGVVLAVPLVWLQRATERCDDALPPGPMASSEWTCTGWILACVGALPAVVLLCWALFARLGVRPGWAVALLAPVLAIRVIRFTDLPVQEVGYAVELALVMGLSYAVAALLLAPRLDRRYRLGAAALLLVAVLAPSALG
ncbi:hypothetical protein GCM10009665_33130 [Kitasatospora nipponensis]|uniref:MYXO-CTERM domain-containing protein n=1 Tax=Kitasatospora nipponensis TaxID=258049 RepID=A0ABP4GYP4_9ACTN